MNDCSAKQAKTADAALNGLYQCILREKSAPLKSKLRTAQRYWVQYRDAHCSAAGYQYEGGSIRPLIEANCKAELTRQRIETLHSAYDSQDSGGKCATYR